MVVVQLLNRLAQRAADGRDVLQLLRRQIVEVLVHRIAGMDAVLDAVEPGHQHCGKREIRVGGGIRITHLDPLRLRARYDRDAAAGRAVTRRIGQQHRRLEAGNEPLVAVRRRVRKSVQRLRVPQDAADVIERRLRQIGVEIAGEGRPLAFPHRLVGVHAGAVIALDRLRHEGGRLAVLVRDIVDHVFVDLHVVGGAHQRRIEKAQFVLRRRDLVMVLFDLQPHVEHDRQHLGAQIALAVDRRHREVAALDRRPVAGIAVGVLLGADVGAFLAVDLVHRAVHRAGVAHIVEHEELGLGPEIGGIADIGRNQVLLGLLGDRARIAAIGLPSQRLMRVAEHDDRGLRRKRVENGGRAIRNEQHVRLVDRFPAGDG